MVSEIRKLGLNTLLLDLSNPRFPRVKDQQEAIDNMVVKMFPKIVNLAKDIVEHGLNPTTMPAVFINDQGLNIVKDGNRRITTLKLLMDPSLIKDFEKRSSMEKIALEFDRTRYKYVHCVTFDDEGEVDIWVENNHNGVSDGRGQEKWDPLMKLRDQRNHGRYVPELDMYELAVDGTEDYRDDFEISTFKRIVNSKSFKNRTSWKNNNGCLDSDLSESDLKRILYEIVQDIEDKGREDHINSRKANSADDIESYLSKKDEKGFFDVKQPSSITLKKGEVGKAVSKKDKVSISKNKLFPEDVEWNIDNKRIRDLYEELKTISVTAHPNAVSVLFRAFVELSVKKYLDDNNIPYKSLAVNIKSIAERLKVENKITDNQLMAIELAINRSDNAISLATELNQYGHNYEIDPLPEWLSSCFNNLRPLLENMYR